MDLINYHLNIEYDGSQFYGSQLQKQNRTVQGELQLHLSKVFQENIKIISCSRTDRKVHALDYHFNFFSSKNIQNNELKKILMHILPNDIRIITVKRENKNFNSRKLAKSKTYRYRLTNQKTVFDRNYAYYHKKTINTKKLETIKKLFIGKHDFTSFTSSKDSSKIKIRTIYEINILQKNEYIDIEITGNGFLYNMIRLIVKAMLLYNDNVYSYNDIKKYLKLKSRSSFLTPINPEGLYLIKVNY